MLAPAIAAPERRRRGRAQGAPVLGAAKAEGEREWLMAAFDFETQGLHGPAVYGTLQWELEPGGDRSELAEVYSDDAMLAAMIEANRPGMRWYAHNAEYDLIYLIDAARRLQASGQIGDIEPTMRGDRAIFKVLFNVINGPILEVYDSMAIATNGGAGISLKKFMAGFSNVGEKRSDVDFEGGEIFDPQNKSHREYAIQDTRGLLDSMVNFDRQIWDHYGVHVKGTISATALKAWQVSLPQDERFWRLDPAREAAAREAYFGGLAFLTSTNKHRDVVSIDVNSMYPYCMRKYGVPAGEMRTCTRYDDGSWRPAPGLYLAEFSTPKGLQMGCVPYRDDVGMCFPRGSFAGWAWNVEIARALRWGYKVKIIQGFCWERIIYPFSDFVTKCENKRIEHSKLPVEMIFKTMQNSLYGKLGTKPDGLEIMVTPPDDLNFRDAAERNARLIEEGWDTPDPGSNAGKRTYFWQKEVARDAAYMLPHWSGWITAHARGVLFDAIEATRAIGGEVICGDTDSLKLERRYVEKLTDNGDIQIGKEYGQFKIDAEYKQFRAYAPKCYSYIEWGPGPRRGGGDYKGRAKGIPGKKQSKRFHQRAFRGHAPKVRWKSSPNLMAVLKGKPNKLVNRSRIASVLENSDSWSADVNGNVRSVLIVGGERQKS